MGHSIGVVWGFEFQLGALGILLQQAQPFQAATDALVDQLNQLLQLAFVRCPASASDPAVTAWPAPASASSAACQGVGPGNSMPTASSLSAAMNERGCAAIRDLDTLSLLEGTSWRHP